MLASVQVDSGNAAIWWLPQWQACWMTRCASARAISITRRRHTGGSGAIVRHITQVRLFAWQQLNRTTGRLRRNEQDAGFGITRSWACNIGTAAATWTPVGAAFTEIVIAVQRRIIQRTYLPVR